MRVFGMIVAVLVFLLAPGRMRAETPASTPQKFVHEGIAVEFSIAPLGGGKEKPAELLEGQDAEVRFKINDSASGTALTGIYPTAWMDLRQGNEATGLEGCRAKIQSFLNSNLSARPSIDLNAYYVLAINDDASISVVDPLFGFGGSKLLTIVRLPSTGQDWVLTRDGKRLFVSMPEANQVAVVDTASWKVIANIEAGARPVRVALQADEKYLWVSNEAVRGGDSAGGVTVIDTTELKATTQIPTGLGHHEIAFATDDRYAFVTNQEDGTLSIIDVRSLQKIKDIETGQQPVALAFSTLSQAVYVAHEGDGGIAVIGPEKQEIVARIQTKPGLKAIRFAPGGRWGFVANWKENVVHVLDSSTNQIVQTAEVGNGPDQISFTAANAFIRSSGTEQVSFIPLAAIGPGQKLPVFDFPGGQAAPEKALNPANADSITPAPEGNAVLVANAVDKMIYFYEEGMAAPMGSFQNYGRQPRAVLVVDRSLREVQPGVYSTTVKLSSSGTYDVAFLLNSPRIVHCFEMAVEPNPVLRKNQPTLQIESLLGEKSIPVGESFRLRFKAIDPTTQQPRSGLKDLGVLFFLAPGTWQKREWAQPTGDGIYEITLTVPQSGVYYVFFQCPSLGIRYEDLPQLILHAAEEKNR